MKRKKTRPKRHILLILLLILAGILLLCEEFGRERPPEEEPEVLKPEILPRVAIVMDDLGVNKELARKVLDIKAPITLSILPHETYTEWIAEEGHRQGHEIIAHVPMEAKEPHPLGRGGLYTWMTDSEIKETLDDALDSIPYIKGISNHMGSAFTEDERAMGVVASELKRRELFFLDSLTTSRSVGIRVSRTYGVDGIKRDVFLDDANNPHEIKTQWERMVRIAGKRGYAIALSHPREDTIRFLKEAIKDTRVRIVPISELIP